MFWTAAWRKTRDSCFWHYICKTIYLCSRKVVLTAFTEICTASFFMEIQMLLSSKKFSGNWQRKHWDPPPLPHTHTHIRTHIHTRIREQPWKSPSWTGLKFLTLKKGSSHFLTTFKVIKLKKNSINFLRLFEFLTEKGHHHCLKVFNTEKGLRHFLTTLKIFNIEKGHSSLPWVS